MTFPVLRFTKADGLFTQLQGDGASGSAMPSFITNSTNWNTSMSLQNQTVSWAPLPATGGWDGFSLIVDDVERYTGTALNFSLAALQSGLPHFLRLAVSQPPIVAVRSTTDP